MQARVKAQYRRASALVGRGDSSDAERARADLRSVLELQPDNKAALALLSTEYFASSVA